MPSIDPSNQNYSISDSIIDIGDVEIKECALEDLEPFKDELEARGYNVHELLNQETSSLIRIWKDIKHFKNNELNDASALADLIKGQIAGFDAKKLEKMCTFSKISYGNVDLELERGKYKTKRQFEKEGYQIIKFYDNDLIQDEYCLDTGYKLEQHNVGYALIGSNSYNRDAGYIFIKDKEVTIAYHGTRDLNDVKEDLRASLAKLSFLPEDHRVHYGFYSLFKRSWPSVHKILKGHANDKGLKIEDLKINVTGHSMGGALASIAALCLNKTEGAEDVHVATFGSPRVFYNGVAEVYNECLGNKTVRVACQSDPVPCLPHGNAGMHYKHVGKPLKLETGKALEYLEPHYHKIDTYYNLIQEVEQENFKSDNNSSKYRHIAYIFGLFYHVVLSYVDVNDKEFFEEVREENKGIKLSEIPIQRAPNLEEKFKQGEQKVAQLTNEKTQLEKRLNSIQQSLTERTEELKSTQAQLEQERSSVQQELAAKIEELESTNKKVLQLEQELGNAKQGLDKITGKFEDKFENSKKELDNQTQNLNAQIEELKRKEIQLEENKRGLDDANQKVLQLQEKLKDIEAQLEQERRSANEKIVELKKAKTELEEKVEFTEKALKDAQTQLKESERGLDVAKKNILQLEKDLKQAQQKLAEETNKVTQLSKESNKTQAQLEEKKKEIGELKDQATQLTAQSNQLEGQLNDARQDLTNKIDEITQLENENNNLKTKLHKSENKSKELERNLQKQSESKNEELNEKFLKARIYSEEQGNYASVSFVLSGAFAVGVSLTMLHLAICISLAVAALTFLAVGCYCSYNANTALNNVEVGQIGNDASHSVV